MSTVDVDDAIRAFIAADREVMVTRAQNVGALTNYLRSVEGWEQEGDAERRRFAARAFFVRWQVRTGLIGVGDDDRPAVPS